MSAWPGQLPDRWFRTRRSVGGLACDALRDFAVGSLGAIWHGIGGLTLESFAPSRGVGFFLPSGGFYLGSGVLLSLLLSQEGFHLLQVIPSGAFLCEGELPLGVSLHGGFGWGVVGVLWVFALLGRLCSYGLGGPW